MHPKRLLLAVSLIGCGASAQLAEDFSDGDFTANPVWLATGTEWIVNGNQQLQSNQQVANSSFFISTPSTLATGAEWSFWLRLNFNTSSANYTDVYVMASSANLNANSTSGYFIRIGNTQDEVALYRKDANGTISKLIDGVDGSTNRSDNVLKIKLVRSNHYQFTLYRDDSGTGNNYMAEGIATDSMLQSSAFFGVLVRQSTASFFQRHYIDDIEIKPWVPDITAPVIKSVYAPSDSTLELLFSEAVDLSSSETALNYTVDNGIGQPLTALRNAANPSLVQLRFARPFASGQLFSLLVNGVKDLAGNLLSNAQASFRFYRPGIYDVVMSEIMADPSPPAGLPNASFIELTNTSAHSINLQGWQLHSNSGSTAPFPHLLLAPDSFLIVTTTNAATLLQPFGRVLGVSGFPTLANAGSSLWLTATNGSVMHAVNYSDSWYRNSVKANGGWTLEMIDVLNPCGGSNNWRASEANSGGTPGSKNSVAAANKDQTGPRLLRTHTPDSVSVVVVFDEPLDSMVAGNPARYAFSNNLQVKTAAAIPPVFTEVKLTLTSAMAAKTIYSLTVTGVQDCKGNAIGDQNKGMAGLSEKAAAADLRINELLFNPRPNGYDYVELYNSSQKAIDVSQLWLANRNGTGALINLKRCSPTPRLLFPNEYLVLTERLDALQKHYLVAVPGQVSETALPSLPDDEGSLVLTNAAGDVLDELHYNDGWHFPLIADKEGVALEKIDPAGPAQQANNWTSAAATAGFGTPTAKNSQWLQKDAAGSTVLVTPAVFSPDNDGFDDRARISYELSEAGFVGNVYLYNAQGRMVRHLVKNATLSNMGGWNWDGLDEQQQALPPGLYVVQVSLFALNGKKQSFKRTVALAARFR